MFDTAPLLSAPAARLTSAAVAAAAMFTGAKSCCLLLRARGALRARAIAQCAAQALRVMCKRRGMSRVRCGSKRKREYMREQ